MSLLLQDKVAVITGAAHGIGRAIARAYFEHGAIVVAADLDADAGKSLVEELDPSAQRMLAVEADVTSNRSVDDLFALVADRFGRLDVLVNNAGGGKGTALVDTSESEWDAMFDLNVKSVFRCCQAALRFMLPRRSGKIINIASAAGRSRTQVAGAHYGSSKAAVIGLTRNLAREVGPHGVHVNAICPGIIATERLVGILQRSGRLETEAETIPLRRLGQPEDVAGAALFLASPWSDYMTGAMVDVNGGALMV